MIDNFGKPFGTDIGNPLQIRSLYSDGTLQFKMEVQRGSNRNPNGYIYNFFSSSTIGRFTICSSSQAECVFISLKFSQSSAYSDPHNRGVR